MSLILDPVKCGLLCTQMAMRARWVSWPSDASKWHTSKSVHIENYTNNFKWPMKINGRLELETSKVHGTAPTNKHADHTRMKHAQSCIAHESERYPDLSITSKPSLGKATKSVTTWRPMLYFCLKRWARNDKKINKLEYFTAICGDAELL